MTVTAADVKALRGRTGAGMLDCKKALEESGGDVDAAVDALRVKGLAKAAKRGDKEASQGVVASYIHAGGSIGSMVEVDCETDFVARNEEFATFARDLALHIAAADPLYVDEASVPEEARAAELRVLQDQDSDKPEEIRAKIAEGRIGKWLDEVVLLRQAHVNADRYEGRTIEDLRAELASKTGENIVIRRFSRFAVGG
ncbi:MAG: translation elongation factor Ts [Solirubrobacterales bacterium]|nr:translation elongation factor Ts [Solirubrobacterales bacterium]